MNKQRTLKNGRIEDKEKPRLPTFAKAASAIGLGTLLSSCAPLVTILEPDIDAISASYMQKTRILYCPGEEEWERLKIPVGCDLRTTGILQREYVHEGVAYAKGTVFHNFWYKTYGTLARDAEIMGVLFKGGTKNFRDTRGAVAGTLAKTSDIHGVVFGEGADVELLLSTVKGIPRDPVVEIGGRRYDGTQGILFDGASSMVQGILAEDTEVNGAIIPEGSKIWIHPNGNLQRTKLSADTEFGGIIFNSRRSVFFITSGPYTGLAHSGSLAEETLIQGITFPVGTGVSFCSKSGRLRSARDFKLLVIDGIKYEDLIELYPSGKIKRADLAEPAVIEGIKVFVAVEYHENGRLKSCYLAEGQRIGELFMRAGTRLEFDEQGHIE
ncbi:MAG: hypothetical protein ABIH29_05980 [Candidatus Micrarchaeota archaeon]